MKKLITIFLILILFSNHAYATFCGYLKADTQTIVTIGPFVDVGDGFTPQTDITLGGNEAELIKHGSTSVVDISGATWAAVTNCRGYYSLTLTTSHTDTEGQLTVIVQDDSDCLPVRNTFMVVNANVFDSLFAAATTDYLSTSLYEIDNSGSDQTVDDLEDFADAGYDPTNNGTNVYTVRGSAPRSQSSDVTAIWAATTRTLTALDEDDTTIDLDGTTVIASPAWLRDTTVASATSARIITLTAGKASTGAYENHVLKITDADDSNEEERLIVQYLSDRTCRVDRPYSFTPAAGDVARIAVGTYTLQYKFSE